MKIIDIVPNWEETFEDYEIEGEITEENFMKHFDLNGEIMMKNEFEVSYGMGHADVNTNFYCGPSIGGGGVSDSVSISNYLDRICKELDVKCDTEVMENYHELIGYINPELAKRDYIRIKKRISKDFKIDIDPDTEDKFPC